MKILYKLISITLTVTIAVTQFTHNAYALRPMAAAISENRVLKSSSSGESKIEELDVFVDPAEVEKVLKEAGNVLTREEEKLLFMALHSRGYPDKERVRKEITDFLIRKNQNLVRYIAKKLGRADQNNYDDAIQDGSIGLLTAISHFDYRLGTKFSTYAVWWIRQSILRGGAILDYEIHIPSNLWPRLSELRMVIDSLQNKLQREPDIEEISKAMEISEKELIMLMNIRKIKPVSIFNEVSGMEESHVIDSIPGEVGVAYEDLSPYFSSLNYTERVVLKMRYGIGTTHGTYTLEKIADILGLTKERVRQVEGKAIKRIRSLSTNPALRKHITAESEDDTDVYLTETLEILPGTKVFASLIVRGRKDIEQEIQLIKTTPKRYSAIYSSMLSKIIRLREGKDIDVNGRKVHFSIQYPLKMPRLLDFSLKTIWSRAQRLMEGETISGGREKSFKARFIPQQLSSQPRLLVIKPVKVFLRLVDLAITAKDQEEFDSLVRESRLYLKRGFSAKTVAEYIRLGGVSEDVLKTLTLAERMVFELSFPKRFKKTTPFCDIMIGEELAKAGFRSEKGGPYDPNVIVRIRERALRKIASGKTGIQLLAQDIEVSPEEITQDVIYALDRRYWEVLKCIYGIGAQKAASQKEIAERLYKAGIRNVICPDKKEYDLEYIVNLRRRALELIRQRKTGLQYLAQDLGISVDNITQDLICSLSFQDWRAICYYYGIGVQRIDSYSQMHGQLKREGINFKKGAFKNIIYHSLQKLRTGMSLRWSLAQELGIPPELIDNKVIDALPERLREVLCMRYGIGRHFVYRAEEVSARLKELGYINPSGKPYSRTAIGAFNIKAKAYLRDCLLGVPYYKIPDLATVEKWRIGKYRMSPGERIWGYRQEKVGIELLAQHLDVNSKDITEDMFKTLLPYERTFLCMYYGIGRSPIPSLEDISMQMNKVGAKHIRSSIPYNTMNLSRLRRNIISHLKKYGSGIEWLAGDVGINAENLKLRIPELSLLEWTVLKMYYGINMQRVDSCEKMVSILKHLKIFGRFGKIKNEDGIRRIKMKALKRLKGGLESAKHCMRDENILNWRQEIRLNRTLPSEIIRAQDAGIQSGAIVAATIALDAAA